MTEVDFPFPIRGLNENWAYGSQPGLTSPDMLNVRPYSADEERARGGQRPGITPAYSQVISGGSNPIQWMGWLDTGFGDTVFYTDEFEYANGQLSTRSGTNWASANANLYVSNGAVVPNTIGNGSSVTTYSSGNHADVVSSSDTWQDFDLETQVSWNSWANGEAKFEFAISGGGTAWVKLELSSTERQQPVTGGVAWVGSDVSLTITTSEGGQWTREYGNYVPNWGSDMFIRVLNGTLQVFHDGQQVISDSIDASNVYTTAVFYLGASNVTSGSSFGDEWVTDNYIKWRLDYYRLTAITRNSTISKEFCALAGRDLWAESSEGTMAAVTSDDRFANIAQYSAAHGNGFLFILDGTTPRYYNPVSGTVSSWGARAGEIVKTCKIIANWRNRICMSGSTDDPHNIFMSRLDDAFDFDYGRSDSMSAVALNTTAMGRIGEPVQALMPISDNQLLVGCTRSVWRLLGDPMAGGQLTKLTDEGGVLGQNAWTMDSTGTVYYMGEHGFYRIQPGGRPEPLSITEIPSLSGYKLVSGAGASGEYYITVAYDAQRHGILIYLTPFTSGTATHYWYDIRTGGFFPEQYQAEQGPTAAAFYNATTPTYRVLLLGGREGYLYKYSDSKSNDEIDGQTTDAISSYVLLQPRRLSGTLMNQSVLTNLIGVLSGDSDAALYEILSADEAEEVKDATAFASGSWVAGRNPVQSYRVSGGAHGVKVKNTTASETWAMEGVSGELVSIGRQR